MSRPRRPYKVTSSFRSSRGATAKGLQPTSRQQIAQLCEEAKVAGEVPGQIAATSRRSTLLPRRRPPLATRPLPSTLFVSSTFVARFASLVFDRRRDPQLALWATNMPPAAVVAGVKIRSEQAWPHHEISERQTLRLRAHPGRRIKRSTLNLINR